MTYLDKEGRTFVILEIFVVDGNNSHREFPEQEQLTAFLNHAISERGFAL
jgi:hypothetical protein